MTTMAENERLAVLETQYTSLQKDVTEIKSDVKAIAAAQAVIATALAAKDAAELQAVRARSNTGVWIRAFLPWGIAFAALIISAINFLTRTDIV